MHFHGHCAFHNDRLEEIGPAIYNHAISDAQTYMQEKALDIENNCFAPDSTYWVKHDKNAEQRRLGR